jgi:PAS domain S-box-containing protein
MLEHTVHILLVEDDPAHAELIRRAFEVRGDRSKLTIAHTLSEALIHLENTSFNLVIADWRLPDGDSSELLNKKPHNPDPPVIIMTSYGSERNAVDVLKSGALDYIVKSSESMTDMPHIAEKAIEQWRNRQEKEKIQIALMESEAQFRLLAENSSDMISKHDTRGTFLYVSPACRRILGYEPQELIGNPVAPLVHPEDAKQLAALLSTPDWKDITITVDYRARHKNGEYIWIETTARPFYDELSGRQEFQASSRNITERKEAEEKLSTPMPTCRMPTTGPSKAGCEPWT